MSKMSEIDMIVTETMQVIETGYYVKDAMRIVQEQYHMSQPFYDYVYMCVSEKVYGGTA